MTNSLPDSYLESSLAQSLPDLRKMLTASWWERQSIRFKITLVAIALGTIPTLAVGSTAYYFAARSIRQETVNSKTTLVSDLQNQVNLFMSDRLGDIKVMAGLDIFSDPQLRTTTTAEQKSVALQKIQEAYEIYNSIAVFDVQGNLVAQTEGKTLGNHLNREYIQEALKLDRAIISQPRISTSSGVYSIYTASPIKDRISGQTIGFVRARIPLEVLNKLLQDYTRGGSQYYLLNNRGEIFLGSTGAYVIKTRSDQSTVDNVAFDYEAIEVTKIFPAAAKILNNNRINTGEAKNSQSHQKQFLAVAPVQNTSALAELNWRAILATDNRVIFAPQRRLSLVFSLGTAMVALAVGAIAYSLANRFLRPILAAADAVQEIGRGNLQTRLAISGADEMAQLGANINGMVNQIQELLDLQAASAQQSETVKNIAIKLSTVNSVTEICQLVVTEIWQILPAQRIVYYQFQHGTSGRVIAESQVRDAISWKNKDILNPELIAAYIAQHQAGNTQVEVIDDIEQANISAIYRQQAQNWNVAASIIAPVVVANQLEGLLMVHQGVKHHWQKSTVEFITQITNQISSAIARSNFQEQQRAGVAREKAAKEAIQARALSLLQEVSEVSQGDLTVRAKVTEDEIGTIADSYNSTIESLQKLVEQTKIAASEVQNNTEDNNWAIQTLATETQTQATAIAQMLEQVKAMDRGIQEIAFNAERADQFVKQAHQTIDSSDRAINHTVAEINAVQTTVTETASKVQKLGESSVEISQAVNLIGRFAAQTHLLALKASIEAARAGEQGKGFAVIAEEVRSLASQSAEATAQIETLVSKIQLETNELAEAMTKGTEQIAAGNELVGQTRQSLTQIAQVSDEISKLIGSIAQTTQKQTQTSNQVSQTTLEIAAIANNNSQSMTQVAHSIEELSAVAAKLQSGIGKFKT